MPLIGLSPSATQAAPLNSAQVSLKGPLKNYVIVSTTYKQVEDVVDTLKKNLKQIILLLKV